jgi:hypothetical protein
VFIGVVGIRMLFARFEPSMEMLLERRCFVELTTDAFPRFFCSRLYSHCSPKTDEGKQGK